MATIAIILRGSGVSNEYKLSIALDIKIAELRRNAQTLLGFDDDNCQIVLERTGEHLPESLLIGEAKIQPGDVLLVIPPEIPRTSHATFVNLGVPQQSKYDLTSAFTARSSSPILQVQYKLILTISGTNQSTWEYSIHLKNYQENNPYQFFQEAEGQEYQKLEDFLEKALGGKLASFQTNKILSEWCEEIAQGHRITELRMYSDLI